MTEEWTEVDNMLTALESDVRLLIDEDFQVAQSTTAYQPSIYHYTNVKGALGIIQTGCLRFTERAHLNDPIEIEYGLKIAHELFEQAAKTRGATITEQAAKHLKGEHDFSLETYGFWIASFSLNGDHLGQWRNYADDGRGVCLGFSIDTFDMTLLAKHLPNEPNSLRFSVSYDEITLRSRLKAHVNLGVNVLEKANLPARPSYSERYGRALLYERDCFHILKNGFLANSLLHKHPAYGDEREYRLLVSGPRSTISKVEYHRLRERSGEIVGYLELPIPQWRAPCVLTHIRLGPAASQTLNDQIGMALTASGVPVPPIDRSGLPYRPTR
jgi:hypothetical protein